MLTPTAFVIGVVIVLVVIVVAVGLVITTVDERK
jgi:hypothetical protein